MKRDEKFLEVEIERLKLENEKINKEIKDLAATQKMNNAGNSMLFLALAVFIVIYFVG